LGHPVVPATTSDRSAIDRLLDEQSLSWRDGRPVRVEDFLGREPGLRGDPEGVLDLIVHELSLRERSGESPAAEEYLARFPWLADRLGVQLRLQGLFRSEGPTDGHPAPAGDRPSSAPAGYEIEGELGRGGMGVVYRARHVALNRPVALKMVLAGLHAGPAQLARVRVEAEAVARLQHPNVVQIFEVGEHDGRPFLALEYIEGGSLTAAFAGTPQAPRGVAELVEALARAVHQVHRRGIVHRDLKPSNILLAADGTPKVADFGLAKLLEGGAERTDSGAVLGTPSYMAPEQAAGRPGRVGPATDVYALGALLYEGLTGRPPFRAETPLETFHQVLAAEVIPPSRLVPKVPRDLETVCLKCLNKDPHRRYESAEALADDLRRSLDDRPIRARRAGRAEHTWRWCRRNPGLAASIALAATALVAVATLSAGFAIYQARAADRLRTEQEAADRERRKAERLALDMALDRGLARRDAEDPALKVLWLTQALALARPEDASTQEAIRINLSAWAARVHPLRQIFQAGGPVTTAAFRPDGRVLATADHDGTAQLWRVADGAPVGRAMAHRGPIRALRFSPDGRRVLTAGDDGDARLWGAADGSPIGRPMAHRGPVNAAAYSPDGRLIVTAGDDGTARLWGALTGAPTGVALLHDHRVLDVAFSPDSRMVLTSGPGNKPTDKGPNYEGSAWLWRATDGTRIGTLRGHRNAVRGVAFSPDGRRLATASNDMTARLWGTDDGRPVGRPMLHLAEVRAVVFSPDGRAVVTGSNDGNARLWDARDGTPIGVPMPHRGPVAAAAFSPDGRTVVTAGYDNLARSWDAATGEPTGMTLAHQGPVVRVAFSPDGRSILTGSVDGTAKLWQAAPHAPGGWASPHGDAVTTLAFSPDGQTVLTGSRDGTARLIRVAEGATIASLRHEDSVRSVAFFPDGRSIMTADQNGPARLWGAADGSPLGRLVVDEATMTAAIRPDGRAIVVGGYGGFARLWDIATDRPIGPPMPHPGWLRLTLFSPDGRRLLTASDDGTARLWDAATAEPASPPLVHRGGVLAGAFSPDSRLVLTGGNDHNARLWHAADGAPAGPPLVHQDVVLAVAFRPDGRMVATGGIDNTVRLWGVDGRPRGITMLHPGPVAAVAFAPDGKALLTGSYDGAARLWCVADGTPIGPALPHRGPVVAVAFRPDGRAFLTGSHDGTARLWPAPTLLNGEARRLALWASVLTGTEPTEGRDRIRVLGPAEWHLRRRQLDDLGGPPAP
jgi:eukaryotic-like serine/threonine-protein kinase